MSRRMLGIATTFLTVVLTTVLTLAVLEVGFRVFKPQQYFSVHANIWDREMGMKQVPGAKGRIIRPEFAVDVIINSKGLRDREYPYAKASGTRRILCLGDSFTMGYGVRAEETYAKVLESLLDRGDQCSRWEVINAGIGGTGTAHQLAFFNAEGYKYDPDLIVLCLCGANDFADNTASRLYSLEDGRLIKHDSVPTARRQLLHMVQRMPGYSTICGRSHLITFLKYRIAKLIYGRRHAKPTDPARQAAARERSDALARQLLLSLRASCRSRNCTLVFTAVPASEGSDALERVASLVEFVRSEGIPFADLTPRFREEASEGVRSFYPLDGHWNAKGHRLVAEILYDLLVAESLLDDQDRSGL